MNTQDNPFFAVLPERLAKSIKVSVPVSVTVGGRPIELALTATGAAGGGFGVHVDVAVTPAPDGRSVEWATTIENDGTDAVREIEVVPVTLQFDFGDAADVPRVRHLSGSWHFDALYPPRAFRLHEEAFLTHDHARPLRIGGINGGIHSPILQVGLGLPLREGFFVGMEWSGGWSLQAGWSELSFHGEARPDFAVSGHADLGPIDLEIGESARVPSVHLGAGAITEWGDLDLLQRRRLRDLMPAPVPPSPLPVSYDTWFGRYEQFDITTLMADATKAAEIGVEVYCLDACWYRSEGVHDGLGNWFTPDPTRFPRGEEDILALSQHVRASGMKFGLWHLIQLAEPDSDAVRARPDVFRKAAFTDLRERNERLFGRLNELPTSFDGMMLALERPEGVEYALEILEYWIENWGVDWFRFESIPEDGLAYNAGYNRLLETLTQRHPQLYIEICNGGGQRLDLSSIRRTHGNWLSDHTSSPEVTRFSQTGASRFWPARMLNMAVTAMAGSGDRHATTYEVLSRMTGVLSFNGALAEWSDAATREVRTAVDAYKSIRHVIDEDVYFPLPQPRSADQWDAIVYSDPEHDETLLYVFRLSGPPTQRITIPWLDRPVAELVLGSDDEIVAVSTPDGLEVALPPRAGAVWRLTAKARETSPS